MTTWTTSTDGHGWTTYTRGAVRITVSPSGKVTRFAPAYATEHATVGAAMRYRTPGDR